MQIPMFATIVGDILIRYADTKDVLVEKHNAIHYGNMTWAVANTLVGNMSYSIRYMAFGNGGTSISGNEISYKQPKVSLVRDPNAQLYTTTYIKEMTNRTVPASQQDPDNYVDVPIEQPSNISADIEAVVLLDFGDETGPTPQNATAGHEEYFPITQVHDDLNQAFVFDEIALYVGDPGLLGSGVRETSDEVVIQNFILEPTTNMVTHVIFQPVQKSQNRSLEIIYTLRVQMSDTECEI